MELKGVRAGQRRCMHESDLFLIDMAAEGRGHTILTRALQLVIVVMVLRNFSGIQDLLSPFNSF